ncbi:MAG: cobyrinate a,c-diamide synthase [Desulfovibrio sp.]|jgi:cobyrinic acid a,c-diamide synthase|nr:cobyrinate a,c-diamide synthase [Desulfovibrio sp.]
MNLPRLTLAAARSGAGKSTLALVLLAAMRERGLDVQPFKAGPDYIDPTLHRAACGRPSYNLDAFLLPGRAIRGLFLRHAPPAPGLSIIEGVMGLYDGLGAGALASTAHIAALLKSPVILVVDAKGQALSAAALVLGFARFRPKKENGVNLKSFNLAGVIFNRIAGAGQYALLRRAVEDNCGIPCLGYLANALPTLPQRHLGLVPAQEMPGLEADIRTLAALGGKTLDLDGLIEIARAAPDFKAAPLRADAAAPCLWDPALRKTGEFAADPGESALRKAGEFAADPGESALRKAEGPATGKKQTRLSERPPVCLGIAQDAAFSFYYQDNFDYLRELGARIIFFSPLRDSSLPPDLDGVFLGGGFPEIFAPGLEDNRSFRSSLLRALEDGLPAYAECGGLLYLCKSLTPLPRPANTAPFLLTKEEEGTPGLRGSSAPDRVRATEDRAYAMCGFFPHAAQMTPRLQTFGYARARLRAACPLGPAQRAFFAHEFHYSRIVAPEGKPEGKSDAALFFPLMDMEKADGRAWSGGLWKKNTVAGYAHLYFRGCPEVAASFLAFCRALREGKKKREGRAC